MAAIESRSVVLSANATPVIIPFPENTVVHQVSLPGTRMPPPKVHCNDLIPPHTAEILNDRWNAEHHDQIISFHCLRNVYVAGEGLVFDSQMRLYAESITQNDAKLITRSFQHLQVGLQENNIIFQPGVTLLCGKIGMSNYGHWMIEMLPMAFLSSHWIRTGLWRVFLPHVYFWMRQIILDSLGRLAVPIDRCIENDGTPRLFEELVVVSGLSMHGHFYSPVSVSCMDVISQSIQPAGWERLWMSRRGERRSFECEEKLCESLKERGWLVVEPGKLNLREQIELCKGAKHIAGVHGAGLTNIGFMRPGERVTIFSPANIPDIFYWHLAMHRGLRYHEVRCRITADPDWHIPWDGLLQMPVDEIIAYLDPSA